MTGRLPFNPERMKSKQTGERAGARDDQSLVSVLGKAANDTGNAAITVSQLATRIDHAIKAGLSDRFSVVGEISSLSHRTHYYFSLKDDKSVIGAVIFASAARRMSYTPKHGDSVIAKGRIEFYAPSGRISLIVTSMTPVGEGDLEAQYKKRCEELRELGWFDPTTKQSLPTFPRRIAVVTSKDGAAVADVIDTMGKRCPSIELAIVDVRVQGDSAKGQIANAIAKINIHAERLGIDAILLARGGGSLEDLWAFNELEVAKAIHDSQVPIVAAIGHETDTTIAELVADERCATPTQAAMRLAPDCDALREQLASMINRLDRTVHSELRYEQQRLDAIVVSRSMSDPREIIKIHRERVAARADRLMGAVKDTVALNRAKLDRFAIRLARHQPTAVHARREEHLGQLHGRLGRVMTRVISARRDELAAISRELHAIGPAQVLARGFTVTAKPDGSLVRSSTDAAPRRGDCHHIC
ncbi:MAG: exodeoxyribonuclease VII large subunit [Phycisphaerales bacterium]|nr:exodeoxyribonuclease VII large subunit [Phycisphaerales bacterium]